MQALQIGLAILVTLVWLIGYGLSFYKGIPKPDGLDYLFGIVLSWAFGGTALDAVKRIRIEKRASTQPQEVKDAEPNDP